MNVIKPSLLRAGLLLAGSTLAAGAAVAAPYTVLVEVDTAYCASVGVQCAAVGHSYAAADSSNHNPIRAFVTVVNKSGKGVTGLPITAFSISNNLTPAGAGSAALCADTVCGTSNFQGGTNGNYAIFLDRASAGNWKAGAYSGTIKVVNGTDQGVGAMVFRIPAP